MKVVAAFLLAVWAVTLLLPPKISRESLVPSELIEAEDEIDLLLSKVSGKDVTELIGAGMEKLASVSGGGGAVATACSGGDGSAAAAAPAAEAKKEEKEVLVEESDDEMCLSLFD